MNIKSLRAVMALYCAALIHANAQTVLISWDVNSTNSASSATWAGTTASNIDSGLLTLGSGLTTSAAANTFGGSAFDALTFADAIIGQDYIAFTITPSAGYALNLTSVEYLAGKASSSTTFSAVLTADRTGFTVNDALDTYAFSNSSPSLRSITLSGITSLQNITGTVEFRLYGVSSLTDTFRIRSNAGADLKINGTLTAVPEPSTTTAIVGVVVLASVLLLRRHRRSASADTKKPAESGLWLIS